MNQSAAYSISVENNQITLQLDSSLIDRDALTRLLDFIELESIRKNSQLTEEQAASLTAEINRANWESVRDKFLEK